MGDEIPMFRAGLVILAVIVAVAGASLLLDRFTDGGGGVVAAAVREKDGDDDDDDGKDGGARGGAAAVASSGAAPAAEGVCRIAAPPVTLPAGVSESSGVAAGRRTPGVFWTHNDSGQPELFAADAGGRPLGRVRVEGAAVSDWEDVAAGPCPAGRCLFVGDIGDNQAARAEIVVYRVPEPAPADPRTAPAQALRARYPDGPHDAEALFVLPDGRVYVVTKGETGHVAVYRFPANAAPGPVATLERVRELAAGEVKRRERVTGADASEDGRWVVLRTLTTLSFYPTDEFLAGRGEPRTMDLKPLNEPQGEAVAFAADGQVVLTSEGGKKGVPGVLSLLRCDLR